MMKTRTLVTGLALSAALTAGIAATAAAQNDPSPPPTTTAPSGTPDPAAKQARTEFVCGHQDQFKDLMNQRKNLISARLSLLREARTSASDAGATQLVARTDKRIEKTKDEATKVEGRMDKFATWVGEHCSG
jgi:hypothetical protein